MDSFRLNPDAVRRVLPNGAGNDDAEDETRRLTEAVRDVEARRDAAEGDADTPPPPNPGDR